MEIFLASVFGLIIGSFLNVVVHRLPKTVLDPSAEPDLSCLLWPASTAPCCDTLLSWYDNIPVVSWVLLKGRCRHCQVPISVRYLAVELLTGLVFAGIVWHWGLTPKAGAYALLMACLICLFFIDLEILLLPDSLTLSALWLGLLSSAFGVIPVLPVDAICGASLGYGLPWTVNALYKWVRKHDGFGGGDFKLLSALGAWTGWQSIVPILCGASILGLFAMGVLALLQGQRMRLQQSFPFGPFLILSGIGVLLSGLWV